MKDKQSDGGFCAQGYGLLKPLILVVIEMFWRSVATLCLGLLLPLAATAQGPKPEEGGQPTPKTVDELDKELQDLKKEVASMREEIAAVATVEDISSALAGLEDRLTEQIAARMSGVDNRVRELTVKTEQLSNSDALRLDANMQDDEFRQTMQKAVNDSIRDTGDVIIRNKMATQQQIQVNMKDYVVDAGGSLTLNVPVGTLTAKLPGQQLTTWTITAPKYEQVIDIVPTNETVTAYRPGWIPIRQACT